MLGREVPDAVRSIAGKLEGRRRRARDRSTEGHLSAHAIYNPDYGPLRAVFVFERRDRPILAVLGGNPGLRPALALLLSGLVCYGLSRLLTNRIQALQHAPRRLADGDLRDRLTGSTAGGDDPGARR